MAFRPLFGTETEYALTAFDGPGNIVLPGDVVRHVARRAALRPHLPAAEPGIFLANGGRFYIDIGNHPEFATPETVNPWDGVRYSLAGDRLLSELVQEVVTADPHIDRIVLRKGNVDYAGPGVTWASHENYLCRTVPLVLRPRLVPHLVSRIVFTGSGGIDPFSVGPPRFVLSPRALFMRRVVSVATLDQGRALVDERDQPHCQDFHRQHLMCGDALRSHLASFLRLGTTALVLALIESGRDEDDRVRLADPLAALDTVTRDVSLTRSLELANGETATALTIQRHYLERARRSLDVLPEWAAAVCDLWQDTLERLSRAAFEVADRLDWAIKLAVYEERAARRGLQGEPADGWLPSAAVPEGHGDETADWRSEICEIDTRFAQLHPPGLFDALDEAGVLRHRVEGICAVDRAMTEPPAAGRASVRGAVVTRLAGRAEEWRCAWDHIEDALTRMRLDLSDPFVEQERWCDRADDPDTAEGLSAQIFRLARSPVAPPRGPSIRELVERICMPGARALRSKMSRHAIDFNNCAVSLRVAGRLDDAVWLMRLALAVDIEARSAAHPKIAHRRNNLGTVLLLLGRLDEMDEQVALAWQVVGPRYDLTSARVLMMRLALALIRREPADLFIGQLKTHLAMQPLPDFADVTPQTGVSLTFDALGPRLGDGDCELLKAIVAVLNTDQPVESLDAHARWRAAEPRLLNVPWPESSESEPTPTGGTPESPTV